ncbi:uncharacterized protein LOC128387687 [Panonychus citri]|uniref:uncharacterized protein LOC128387687 n=1 Tax=Panonychus citri TaxID=50023 RepID=UPI002308135D|nr:uncharacterized protein LOC128387687 [Panonychus citri]
MSYELIESNKGHNLIVQYDYVYRKKSSYGTTSYWTCETKLCKVRGKLHDGKFTINSDHIHEPDKAKVIQRHQHNIIKEKVIENPTETGLNIYTSSTQSLRDKLNTSDDQIASAIKPFISVQPTISRSKLSMVPKLPASREEINLPNDMKVLPNGQNFLIADEGEGDRILVFGSFKSFQRLAEADNIYMDGTFKSCPKLFYQIYTIHVMINKLMVPVIYCLLPDKRNRTYERLFEIIENYANYHGIIFKPKTFSIDFEIAVISTIKKKYPEAQITGCMFHFAQCIRRKVGNLGLTNRCQQRDDNRYTKTIKRLQSLPLIKYQDLAEVFEIVVAEAPEDNEMDALLEYFYDNFFKDAARFPNDIWNHSSNNGPRTTNHIEGWHNLLNNSIKVAHPNLWIFIKKIMSQNIYQETKLATHLSGQPVLKRNKKREAIEKRFDDLKNQYNSNEITAIRYLDLIKYVKLS